MNGAAHPLKSELLVLIKEHPGLNINELAQELGQSRGNVRYHIRKLVEEESVVTRRQGHHVLHFSPEMPERERAAISLLRVGSVRTIVEQAMDDPVIDIDAIANELGVSGRSIRRSIRMLTKESLAVDTPAKVDGRPVRILKLHRQTRIAWVFWCKNAEGDTGHESLWKAPGWLFGMEMVIGQMIGWFTNN